VGDRYLEDSYDDGTSQVVLSPMEFMGRLAALVPKPLVNLTGSYGFSSPRSKLSFGVVRLFEQLYRAQIYQFSVLGYCR